MVIDVIRRIEQKTFASLVEPRLAAIKLAVFAGFSALVYWLAFVRPANLFEIYRTAQPDLYKMYAAGSPVHLGILLAFLALALVYWLAYRLTLQVQERSGWIAMLGGSLAFAVVLLYVFPFDAADIFDYIIHGRMTAVYGVNPYQNTPNQYPGDPFFPYVAWKGDPSPYGPVWEILSGLASRLAGDGIVANILAYKLIPGLFLFASIGVVALVLRREAPRHALAGTLLLAWNPVVLYETWAHGHNDMVMVFWVLAAAWAIQHRRYTLGIMALGMSALVKFVPALLIPAALVIAMRELASVRQRLIFLIRTAASGLILAGILYSPFWYGLEVITVVERTNLFTASISAIAYYSLRGSLGKETAASTVAMLAFFVTVVFVLWQAWQARRRDHQAWQSFTHTSFIILAFYLLVTCLWFQQWYTLWLIGLAPLLVHSKRSRLLAILIGFLALSKQLVIGPILFVPRAQIPQPWLELWFTLGVLGIPWVLALYTAWKSYKERVTNIK
jgi:hypothetical protein